MPCAISTFSDSSDRNSSVVSESVIDRVERADRLATPGCLRGRPRSRARPGAAISVRSVALALRRDAAVEQELQRLRRLAGLVEHASRLVPHLAPETGDAEQLVDRREAEELARGAADRRARRPAAARATARAAARRACGGRPAPTIAASNTYQSRGSRCASACSRSSASVHISRCSTSWIAAGRDRPDPRRARSCASVSSTSRGRVLKITLPLRMRSSAGISSTSIITRLRTSPSAGCRGIRSRPIAVAHPRCVERVPDRGDVLGRMNQAEQPEDAVDRALHASR